MPFGVSTNFVIDGKPYIIPMAVEETSIVAACSKTARWVAECGELRTEVLGTLSTGQVIFSKGSDFKKIEDCVRQRFSDWAQDVNQNLIPSMFKRGGGLKSFELRNVPYPDGSTSPVLHLHMDVRDSMGANLINQICEYLKPKLEKQTGERVILCILSNLADKRLFKAHLVLRNQNETLIQKIEEASLFAEADSYRATTGNKGVLNGVDALMIATGNDWRAVESGLHAYASRTGRYTSLTEWRVKERELHGVFTGPLMLGTVGGVTDLHPRARMSLEILKNPTGEELACIAMAVGLVQNLGALKALVTEGVIEGHMKLHVKNLSIKAGATKDERPFLERSLTHLVLSKKKGFSLPGFEGFKSNEKKQVISRF